MLKVTTKVLILLLTSTSLLQAQTAADTRTPFRFGIHASPNLSFLSSNDGEVDGSLQAKFGFGLITEFNFADNYSFSTGVEYVFRGAKGSFQPNNYTLEDGSSYDGRVVAEFKSGMVQIPVMLKMRTRPFGYYTYFADFGGSLNVNTAGQVNLKPTPTPNTNTDTGGQKPVDVAFGGVMFSIGLGGEYDLGGQTALLLGIYYNRSLFDNISADGQRVLGNKGNTYRFDYVNLKVGVLF